MLFNSIQFALFLPLVFLLYWFVFDRFISKSKWQLRYKYLNYTENYDLCNDTLNFCVSVHLNPTATDKFSADFAHDLDSLGVLSE